MNYYRREKSFNLKESSGGTALAESGRVRKSFPLKGVTIIELFIATAIVGILALLAIPRFPLLIQRAQRTEAMQVMSQIREAELAYNTEYPGLYTDDFAGFAWDVPQESKNFDYSVNAKAKTVIAANKKAGQPSYRMNIITGQVTQF